MKDKFLEELRNKLIDLNDKDVDDTIAYFNEMIEDKVSEGFSEEEVIKGLGKPQDVAITLVGEEKGKVDNFSNEVVSDFDDENVERSCFPGNRIDEINLETVYHKIIIKESNGDEVIFEYPKSNKYYYDVSLSGGSLDIEYSQKGLDKFMKKMMMPGDDTIRLYLPAKSHIKLNIDNVSGSMEISDLQLDSADIENVSGVIRIESVILDSLDAETVSGPYHLHNVKADEISLESVSGRIDMTMVRADDIDLETVSGSLNLEICGNKEDYNISIEKMFADVDIESESGEDKRLHIETVSGSINYRFV